MDESGPERRGGAGDESLESIAEELRSLARRARRGEDLGMGPEVVALLEAAAEGLEGMPRTLRDGMRTAFEIGREHGKKEELLSRLERSIAEETSRLGRQAWGEEHGPSRA